ncbi:Zinc ribbon domain protein [Arthrobacter saudimassiliensis]|uniref:Zinc ribbon domain protein n=1 Tax=Arthrobacter saudimassiliensis TaxID=1461584 RepID=A0A078MUR7_9MICC|nr:Zinc ribbon domain protein [Arthrobacter saudimassiliensis]
MAVYEYRCPDCTDFDAVFPIGEAADSVPCPTCAGPAGRRISSPFLSRSGSAAYRLIDATKRSADEPAVVSSPGPGTRRPAPVTTNPLHRKLPRPD